MFWAVLLSSFFANQALQVSSDAWLRVWAAAAKDEVEHNASSVFAPSVGCLSSYLRVYNFLSVMYTYTGSLHASRILYREALDRALHLPIRFFETTPLDRIINRFTRFTRDKDTVVQQFLVPGLVISVLLMLKRHGSTTNSPAYSHLAKALNGVTVIRAFGFEERFNTYYQELLGEHNRPFFLCLGLAFVSLFAGLSIVLRRGTIDAGAASLSLTYSLAFANNVFWFVHTWAYNEINMNCVERTQGYMALPQENWLYQGEIQVQNLIGIEGRMGARKSTLAVSLFRFVEVTSGKIEIDGVDISRIGDKVLFIVHEHDDTALWAAFKRVHLVSDAILADPSSPSSNGAISSNNNNGFGNLDKEVKGNGSKFSQGQRQLAGLARALLKNSKIIIMDEATSSVNQATDAKIHATIRESFHDATLLTIAHRLKTIIDFDRVIVMDHGSIVQMDTPEKLIVKEGGDFRTVCRRPGGFELLLELVSQGPEELEIELE
ncbi:YHL035Cp-like protein [Linnemannia elongata]|nr:YHL035Cp-like protein [Linnemannia elongata]